MKVKGLVNGVLGEFEIDDIEIISEDLEEPLVFTKDELNDYIENFIVEFLTEGEVE